MSNFKVCLCCGRDLEEKRHFAPGMSACGLCMAMPIDEIVRTTARTRDLRHNLIGSTRAARTAARRDAKLALYAKHGKRCGACHYPKPASDYAKLERSGDGLQAVCRACCQLRITLVRRPGGKQLWEACRDQLRAKAAEQFPAAK